MGVYRDVTPGALEKSLPSSSSATIKIECKTLLEVREQVVKLKSARVVLEKDCVLWVFVVCSFEEMLLCQECLLSVWFFKF